MANIPISQMASGAPADPDDLLPIARSTGPSTYANYSLKVSDVLALMPPSGVTSLIAGIGISLSGPTGDVTITATGTGTPGGTAGQIQINDGAGNFAGIGYTDSNSNVIEINGPSDPLDGNTITDDPLNPGLSYVVIGGGSRNLVTGDLFAGNDVLAGGIANQITSAFAATVSGGGYNWAAATYSVIAGGYGHYTDTSADWSVIGGGLGNSTYNQLSTVVGGYANSADGYTSTVLGGEYNIAEGNYSTVLGSNAYADLSQPLLGPYYLTQFAQGANCPVFVRGGTQKSTVVVGIVVSAGTTQIVPIPLRANMSLYAVATFMGTTSAGNAQYAAMKRAAVISNGVSSVVNQVIGTDLGSNAGSPPVGWTVALNTYGPSPLDTLQLSITNGGANDANWTVSVEMTETAQL